MDAVSAALVARLRLQGEAEAADEIALLHERAEKVERRLAAFHSLLLDFVARVTAETTE